MADPPKSRFTPQNQTTQERLSSNTVGLITYSDYRKRRAEVTEQQEREAREAHHALSATNTPPDRSLTGTPNNAGDGSEAERQARKKRKRLNGTRSNKLSFAAHDEDEEESIGPQLVKGKGLAKSAQQELGKNGNARDTAKKSSNKLAANKSVGIVPRALTKSAMLKEATEREEMRKQFLVLQSAVKAAEIAIPFVFYDGTNIPGGTVRVSKGEFIWVFLDKSRKVGAELGVGGEKNANALREWARVGVDDLMLVRGTIIVPHHYEFYFFIMNKSVGPDHQLLFDYSAEAPTITEDDDEVRAVNPLSNPSKDKPRARPDIATLEGASDDPTVTKVVDRRWYERNKHIYPASVWQEFDPEKDYQSEVRRDPGGNTFFFSG